MLASSFLPLTLTQSIATLQSRCVVTFLVIVIVILMRALNLLSGRRIIVMLFLVSIPAILSVFASVTVARTVQMIFDSNRFVVHGTDSSLVLDELGEAGYRATAIHSGIRNTFEVMVSPYDENRYIAACEHLRAMEIDVDCPPPSPDTKQP